MGMSALQAENQADRRRQVASMYVARVPKAKIARELEVNVQTINRDVVCLLEKWNKELVKDPVAARARQLATMQELESNAAEKFRATNEGAWWDRWLIAVQAISRFLGLDAPIQVDAHIGVLPFTVEFETPSGRIVDAAQWEIMRMEDAEDEITDDG